MTHITKTFGSFTLSAGLAFLGLAPIAYAQTAGSNGVLDTSNVGKFLQSLIVFMDTFIVPLVFAAAFIVFIWGIYSYFIAGGANEEKRESGKQLMLWGLIGFFLMFSVWGIINVLNGTFGFAGAQKPSLPLFNQSNAQQTQTHTNTNTGGAANQQQAGGSQNAGGGVQQPPADSNCHNVDGALVCGNGDTQTTSI